MELSETKVKMNEEWEMLVDDYFFSKNLRPATEWSYRKVVQGFTRHIGQNVTPQGVGKNIVFLWRRHLLKERNFSAYTWNNKVSHLRALFNQGIKHKIITLEENPFNGVSVRAEKKKKRILTRQQLTRVYLIMEQYQDRERRRKPIRGGRCALYPTWYWMTVLDTLRYTGMRNNQLLHIRIADVDIENSWIELRHEGSKNHREWKVPLVRQLKERISLLLTKARARGASGNDLLFDVRRFTGSRGKIYIYDEKKTQQTARSFFRRLSRECGFDVSSHRFRHTLATELMKAPDRNLKLVKDLLGHRSVTTTMEYVEMDLEAVSRTLEQELMLFTDTRYENEV